MRKTVLRGKRTHAFSPERNPKLPPIPSPKVTGGNHSSQSSRRVGAPGGLGRLSVGLQRGHDLAVREFEPRVGLCADSSLRPSLTCTLSVSHMPSCEKFSLHAKYCA